MFLLRESHIRLSHKIWSKYCILISMKTKSYIDQLKILVLLVLVLFAVSATYDYIQLSVNQHKNLMLASASFVPTTNQDKTNKAFVPTRKTRPPNSDKKKKGYKCKSKNGKKVFSISKVYLKNGKKVKVDHKCIRDKKEVMKAMNGVYKKYRLFCKKGFVEIEAAMSTANKPKKIRMCAEDSKKKFPSLIPKKPVIISQKDAKAISAGAAAELQAAEQGSIGSMNPSNRKWEQDALKSAKDAGLVKQAVDIRDKTGSNVDIVGHKDGGVIRKTKGNKKDLTSDYYSLYDDKPYMRETIPLSKSGKSTVALRDKNGNWITDDSARKIIAQNAIKEQERFIDAAKNTFSQGETAKFDTFWDRASEKNISGGWVKNKVYEVGQDVHNTKGELATLGDESQIRLISDRGSVSPAEERNVVEQFVNFTSDLPDNWLDTARQPSGNPLTLKISSKDGNGSIYHHAETQSGFLLNPTQVKSIDLNMEQVVIPHEWFHSVDPVVHNEDTATNYKQYVYGGAPESNYISERYDPYHPQRNKQVSHFANLYGTRNPYEDRATVAEQLMNPNQYWSITTRAQTDSILTRKIQSVGNTLSKYGFTPTRLREKAGDYKDWLLAQKARAQGWLFD